MQDSRFLAFLAILIEAASGPKREELFFPHPYSQTYPGEPMPDYPDEDGYETDAAGTFKGLTA